MSCEICGNDVRKVATWQSVDGRLYAVCAGCYALGTKALSISDGENIWWGELQLRIHSMLTELSRKRK